MNNEKLIKTEVKSNLRRQFAGDSMLAKLVSKAHPIIWINRVYIGPGNWEINPWDMSDERTREYLKCDPEAIEKIQLSENEAFARVNAYFGLFVSRRYDYTLKNEDGTWKVKKIFLSGMS